MMRTADYCRRIPSDAGRLALIGCVCIYALTAKAAPPDFSELEQVAIGELKENNIPGSALAVVSESEIVFAKGFGVASVETGDPVRPEMLFRIGSATKMFTGAAVVMLAEEGKVRFDAPVGNYVPGLSAKIAQLTAGQLLSHTAGLSDDFSQMDGLHDDTALGIEVRKWKEDMLFTQPGRIFSYSNAGYWLAGAVAGNVEGRFYADVMDARIFKPLAMTRSTFRPTMAMTYPLAVGHEPGEGGPRVRRPMSDNAATRPSGQMFSNVRDLSRWCIAMMNGGQLDGNQALSPSLIRELTTPRAEMIGLETKYGYGLLVSEWNGGRLWQHHGSRAGYGAHVQMAPDHKHAVILLTNVTAGMMPKTTKKAMELAGPLAKPSAEALAEVAKSPAMAPAKIIDLAQCAGRYKNGTVDEELVMRGDKLIRRRGISEDEVVILTQLQTRTITGRMETLAVIGANGKAELLLVMGEDGKPAFMSLGDRALARLAD